jgi:hypothetical protein
VKITLSLGMAGVLVAIILMCNRGPAESPNQSTNHALSFYSRLNDAARGERAGDATQIPVLVHGAFSNAGIPVKLADAVGFTERISQAQQSYVAGTLAPIHEAAIVRAVNNFASSLGTPAWTHTTPDEIRLLRVRLVAVLPQLFAYEGPPDAARRYPLLSPKMSPVEASFIAVTMLNMKAFNHDFQFTAAERIQNEKLDPVAVRATLQQRQQLMFDIVQGRSDSISFRDLLAAGDHLFSDLGIPETAEAGRNASPTWSQTVGAKGGL